MNVAELYNNGGYIVSNPNYNPKKKKNTELPYKVEHDPNRFGNPIASAIYEDNPIHTWIMPLKPESGDYGIRPNRISDTYTELANAQSNWTKVFNSLAQTLISEGIGGTLSAIADTPQALWQAGDLLVDKVLGGLYDSSSTGDYSNPVSATIDEWRDKFNNEYAPIYADPSVNIQNGGFSSLGWYAKNFPQLASSLTLLIPSKLVTSGIAKGIKALTAVNRARKVERVINRARQVDSIEGALNTVNATNRTVNPLGRMFANPNLRSKVKLWAERGSDAVIMRTLENYQEAHQSYESMFDEAYATLNKMDDQDYAAWVAENKDELEGINTSNKEEVAKKIARNAADRTFAIDYSNTIFDVIQLAGIRSIGRLAKNIRSFKANRAHRASIANAGLDNEALVAANKGSKIKNAGHWLWDGVRGTSSFVISEGTEGIEEAINYIAQEEGITYGRALLDGETDTTMNGFFNRRLLQYMSSPELQESAFWGLIGGVVFGGVVNQYSKYKINKARKAELKEREELLGSESKDPTIGTGYSELSETPEVYAAITAIKRRNVLLNQLVADLKMVDSGKNPFNVDDNNRPQDIENDNEAERESIKQKLIKEYRANIALQSVNSGTTELLLDYLQADAVKKAFVDLGIVSQNEVDSFINETVKDVQDTRDLYEKQLSRVNAQVTEINKHLALGDQISIEYVQQIAKMNVDVLLEEQTIDKQIEALQKLRAEIEKDDTLNTDDKLNTIHSLIVNSIAMTYGKWEAKKQEIREDPNLSDWRKAESIDDLNRSQQALLNYIKNDFSFGDEINNARTATNRLGAMLYIIRTSKAFKPFGKIDVEGKEFNKTDEELIKEFEDYFDNSAPVEEIKNAYKVISQHISRTTKANNGLASRNAKAYQLYDQIAQLQVTKAVVHSNISLTSEAIRNSVDTLHNRNQHIRKEAIAKSEKIIRDIYTKYKNTNHKDIVNIITRAAAGDRQEAYRIARELFTETDDDGITDGNKLVGALKVMSFSKGANKAAFTYVMEVLAMIDEKDRLQNQNSSTNGSQSPQNGQTNSSSAAAQQAATTSANAQSANSNNQNQQQQNQNQQQKPQKITGINITIDNGKAKITKSNSNNPLFRVGVQNQDGSYTIALSSYNGNNTPNSPVLTQIYASDLFTKPQGLITSGQPIKVISEPRIDENCNIIETGQLDYANKQDNQQQAKPTKPVEIKQDNETQQPVVEQPAQQPAQQPATQPLPMGGLEWTEAELIKNSIGIKIDVQDIISQSMLNGDSCEILSPNKTSNGIEFEIKVVASNEPVKIFGFTNDAFDFIFEKNAESNHIKSLLVNTKTVPNNPLEVGKLIVRPNGKVTLEIINKKNNSTINLTLSDKYIKQVLNTIKTLDPTLSNDSDYVTGKDVEHTDGSRVITFEYNTVINEENLPKFRVISNLYLFDTIPDMLAQPLTDAITQLGINNPHEINNVFLKKIVLNKDNSFIVVSTQHKDYVVSLTEDQIEAMLDEIKKDPALAIFETIQDTKKDTDMDTLSSDDDVSDDATEDFSEDNNVTGDVEEGSAELNANEFDEAHINQTIERLLGGFIDWRNIQNTPWNDIPNAIITALKQNNDVNLSIYTEDQLKQVVEEAVNRRKTIAENIASQLNKTTSGSVEEAAANVLMQSKISSTVSGNYGDIFKDSIKELLDRYAKIQMVSTVKNPRTGQTKRIVSVGDLMKLVKSVCPNQDNEFCRSAYNMFVAYLNTAEARLTYEILDEDNLNNDKLLQGILTDSLELVTEKLGGALINILRAPLDTFIDVMSGLPDASVQKQRMMQLLNTLKVGDKLDIIFENGSYIISKDGITIARWPLPEVSGDHLIQYNNDWRTDVYVANGKVESRLKDILEDLFLNNTDDAKAIQQLMIDIFVASKYSNKPIDFSKYISQFTAVPTISNLIKESIEIFKNKEEGNMMRVYYSKRYRKYYVNEAELIRGLYQLWNHTINEIGTTNLNHLTAMMMQESLNVWFQKMYDTYATIQAMPQDEDGQVIIEHINEGNCIQVSRKPEVEYQTLPTIQDGIAELNNAHMCIINNDGIHVAGMPEPNTRFNYNGRYIIMYSRNKEPEYVKAFGWRYGVDPMNPIINSIGLKFQGQLNRALTALFNAPTDQSLRNNVIKLLTSYTRVIPDRKTYSKNVTLYQPPINQIRPFSGRDGEFILYTATDRETNEVNGIVLTYSEYSRDSQGNILTTSEGAKIRTNKSMRLTWNNRFGVNKVGLIITEKKDVGKKKDEDEKNAKFTGESYYQSTGRNAKNNPIIIGNMVNAITNFLTINSQFDISAVGIESDNNKAQTADGYIRRVTKDDGTSVIQVAGAEVSNKTLVSKIEEFESYDALVKNGNLVRVNTKKNKYGSNYDRTGVTFRGNQTLLVNTEPFVPKGSGPVGKRIYDVVNTVDVDVKLKEQLKENILENASKVTSSSYTIEDGIDFVQKLFDTAGRSEAYNKLNELIKEEEIPGILLLPTKIVYDAKFNSYEVEEKDGEKVVKQEQTTNQALAQTNTGPNSSDRTYHVWDKSKNRWTTKRVPAHTTVVGNNFLNRLSSTITSNQNEAIRVLVHEQLHQLINSHKNIQRGDVNKNKAGILPDIASIYEDFVRQFISIENTSNDNHKYVREWLQKYSNRNTNKNVVLEEFLVEAMTSVEFFNTLNEMSQTSDYVKQDAKPSLITRIMNVLRKLFGFGEIKDNSLNQQLYETLMEVTTNNEPSPSIETEEQVDNNTTEDEQLDENNPPVEESDNASDSTQEVEDLNDEIDYEEEYAAVSSIDVAFDPNITLPSQYTDVSSIDTVKEQIPEEFKNNFQGLVDNGYIDYICKL